jgi:signal transduction histidine kinase
MTAQGALFDSVALATRVLKTFMDSGRLAYAEITPDLTIAQASANLPTLLDRPGSDLQGWLLTDFLWEFVGSESALTEIMAGKAGDLRLEYVQIPRQDGSTGYCSFQVRPVDRAVPGRGLLLLVEDVTPSGEMQQSLVQDRNELRLVKRELARANEELHRLNQLKSLFLSMAAHDIRTPLTSVRGYSNLLLSQSSLMPAEHARLLRIIAVQSQRLNRLISDMLDVGRIEQDRLDVKPADCDLNQIIRDVVDSVEAYALDQQKVIHVTVPEEPLILWADPEAIWRVLYNLISNAIKYTKAGADIRIVARSCADKTVLEVSDNGVGMSEAQVANLFQLYYRTEEATHSEVSGTGIGLFIVKTLVEAHGGHIDVDSRVDKGSTFTISLPTQR